MFTMLALGALIFAAITMAAVLGLVAAVLKGLFFLLFLPFRLVAGILMLPFRLLGGLIGLLMVPLVGVVGLLALGAAVLGGVLLLAIPLLPLAAIAVIIWALSRAKTVPSAA